jgi:hypothetical protein
MGAMVETPNGIGRTSRASAGAIRVRVKASVKAMAEQLAQKDERSMADWLERLTGAERARRAARRKG